MDWVLYMRGLTHMAQDRNFMHDLFNIDRRDRDPEPVKAAFADFKKLLQRYPNSHTQKMRSVECLRSRTV